MRFTAAACLLAGCQAFQPLHLLRSQALTHRSCLALTTDSHEGASDALRAAAATVDFDKLASFAQSEYLSASYSAPIDEAHLVRRSYTRKLPL
jgi:hypothetical protein